MASSSSFWNDNENAQAILKERSQLETVVEGYQAVEKEITDLQGMLELAIEEEDESIADDLITDIDRIELRLADFETERVLSDPMDRMNAFVQFAPGAGGIDSADWAAMLLRMVSRYSEK